MTQRTWRSPWRIPPDPGPPTTPEDLAARVAFKAAWRARAFGQALGHGLKRVPGGEPQRAVVARLASWLEIGEAYRHAVDDAGVAGSEALVLGRLVREPLPAIESWAEVGLADVLMGTALERGLEGLRGTSDQALSAALRRAGRPAPAFGALVLEDVASDPRNLPCLQILIDRWVVPAAHVFGRRSAAGDPVLRSLVPGRDAAQERWLLDVSQALESFGLELTDGQRAGLALPDAFMRPGRHLDEHEDEHD